MLTKPLVLISLVLGHADVDRARTLYLKIWYSSMHAGYFKLNYAEEIWEMTGTGRIPWSTPEAGHKTMVWKVSSLYSK